MKRRILFSMLIGVAFAVTVGASNAEARVFRRLRGRRPACCKPVMQPLHGRHAVQTRNPSSTWGWDVPLEVRTWKWPPYYQH